MKKKKKEYEDDERTIKLRNSRKIYFPIYIMILILIGVVGYIKFNNLPLNKFAFYGAIAFVVLGIKLGEVHRLFNRYELTSEYIIHSYGFFSTNVTRIYLPTISDLILKQSVWQKLLNYGNIEVHRYSDGSVIDLKNIPKPSKFLRILEKRLDKAFKRG